MGIEKDISYIDLSIKHKSELDSRYQRDRITNKDDLIKQYRILNHNKIQ